MFERVLVRVSKIERQKVYNCIYHNHVTLKEGKSFDRMNMTKKFVHDRKDHTDEHCWY